MSMTAPNHDIAHPLRDAARRWFNGAATATIANGNNQLTIGQYAAGSTFTLHPPTAQVFRLRPFLWQAYITTTVIIGPIVPGATEHVAWSGQAIPVGRHWTRRGAWRIAWDEITRRSQPATP